MTIFGPDISSYQRGLVLSRLSDAAFVIAKTTEGTYYTDADYPAWRQQAAALGKPFVWYHFLSGEDPASQAGHTAANVGDKSLPGMLDAEPAGSYSPTLAQILAYIDAAHATGLNLRLCYLPRWYWEQLGAPSLSGLADRGVRLVASAYPGGSGTPASLYPGDGAGGWGSYGGQTPLIYQYTNQASDGGQLLDYNAYRGTVQQLAADLRSAAPSPGPTTTQGEDNMALCIGSVAEGVDRNGKGACTAIPVPPPEGGQAGWGGVWFSLAADDPAGGKDAHLRVTAYINGKWTEFHTDLVVPIGGARVIPFDIPLLPGTEKISLQRVVVGDGSEYVPVGWMLEARQR